MGPGEKTGQKLGASDQGKSVWNGEQEGDRSWRECWSTGALPQASADSGKSHEGYGTAVGPPWRDILGLSRQVVR